MSRDNVHLPPPPAIDRPGDRWVCGVHASGKKCVAGPSGLGTCPMAEPCCPRRTWLGRRKAVGFAVLAIAVAALFLCSRQDHVSHYFKPGELTTPHAQILAGTLNEQRCAACHTEASMSPQSWFGRGGVGHDAVSQTDRCLDCHHSTIDRQSARLAHNLPSEVRQQIRTLSLQSAALNKTNLVLHATAAPGVDPEHVQCAACHREHRGADANLMLMTDAQCQTCHSQQMGSFADTHPQWTDWPYGRGGRIAFNHSSHAMKHFPATRNGDSATEFRCLDCHVKDENHELSRVVRYESACQSCHDEALRLESDHGIELFALPTIPESQTHEMESWPIAATGFYDGIVAPLSELFLRHDHQVASALRQIESRDFSRIRVDSRDQPAAATTIAAAHRRLLADVARHGQSAMIERAEASAVSSAALTNVIRSIPPQMLSDTYRMWFLNAADPLAVSGPRQRAKHVFKTVAAAQSPRPQRDPLAGNAANSSDDDLLLADELGSDDSLLVGDELLEDDRSSGDLLGGDNELIAEDPLAEDPLTVGADAPGGVSQQSDGRFDPDRMLIAGGWYRDELKMAIVYRGSGHADPVVRSAIEALATLPANDPIRKRMLANRTVAACITCHPAASEGVGNWTSPPLVGQGRTFTKFSHRPHMNIAGLTDCVHCHRVRESGHDFEPLKLESCATCHTDHGAGESCTKCHRYHVDSF
ncbi:cytochrome c3 family protein [Novipirellula caenicola]|uniref:Doubled CXXCH motif n=1 Tax=Novipirellula caenicola TaxID=1536901 RepID=A0ABP9VLA4_9BACT